MLAQTLFLLICGHAIADFAIQSEWVATNKNRHARKRLTADQEKKFEVIWPWLLGAHSMHHGLAVFLITQNFALGILETVVHWFIDFGKCEGYFGFHADQILHVVSKIAWIGLIYWHVV